MQIIPSSGLNDTEIERMVKDAEKFAGEDAKRKSLVEAANQADNAGYSAEKMIRENEDKIPDALKGRINQEIEGVKEARGRNDAEAMTSAVTRLQNVMQEAGAAMYQTGGPATGGPTGPTGNHPGDEEVIEGEFS